MVSRIAHKEAPALGAGIVRVCGVWAFGLLSVHIFLPDSREDLESRSPNLGPYTTKGTL